MKSRLAKIISLILALTLIIGSGACLQSFAAKDEDFDSVVQRLYSPMLQDMLNGEEVEFYYYGKPMTYDLAAIDALAKSQQNSLFGSGENAEFDSDRNNSPTHQRICLRALEILLHDKGTSMFNDEYYYNDEENNITFESFTDLMVYHSASPDENERGSFTKIDEETGRTVYASGIGFNGHFYDPYTEKNWSDGTADTCKTNARRHYDAAVDLYGAGRYDEAFEELARGCHYVQDACQTQHANNLTAVDDGSGIGSYLGGAGKQNRHAIFEQDIDKYIRDHMPYESELADKTQPVFDDSIYNEATKISVENIVRNNDYSSYVLLDKSDFTLMRDKDSPYEYSLNVEYFDSATAQFKNATIATAQYLYHFATEVGMPFTPLDY